MAEIGSLSSGAKMAIKIFVKRVFTISTTHAFFLRVIANLQIYLSEICNIYHVIVQLAYVQAYTFRLSPNFLAGAPRAPAQLLPPCKKGKICFADAKKKRERRKGNILL